MDKRVTQPNPNTCRHAFNLFLRCPQVLVAQKVTAGVYKGVTTAELDELAAETAASMTATHPDYALVCIRAAHLTTSGAVVLLHQTCFCITCCEPV